MDKVGVEPTSRGGVSPAFHNATYPYKVATLKTSSMQARICGNLLPKFYAIPRVRLRILYRVSSFESGEDYLLVSSHPVSGLGDSDRFRTDDLKRDRLAF